MNVAKKFRRRLQLSPRPRKVGAFVAQNTDCASPNPSEFGFFTADSSPSAHRNKLSRLYHHQLDARSVNVVPRREGDELVPSQFLA
jgi:hypothetical protein